MLHIDRKRLLGEIKKRGEKRVVLQLPEGLKHRARELAFFLEDRGFDVLIAADPCFGACDVYEGEGLVIHFGHTPVYEPKGSVVFFEVEDDFDFIPIISQSLARLPQRLGLITTVQHMNMLPKVRKYLEEKGFVIFVGRGRGRIKRKGQILGCSFHSARAVEKEVDAFLYLGSGMFHPLGIALATGKPVYRCFETLEDVAEEKDMILKKRYGQIFRAGTTKNFGILVSKKKGQGRMREALKIKGMLEKEGRNALIVEMDDISEHKVSSMGFDAYVICACPRIAVDDEAMWKRPALTPREVEVLLHKKDYIMDELG